MGGIAILRGRPVSAATCPACKRPIAPGTACSCGGRPPSGKVVKQPPPQRPAAAPAPPTAVVRPVEKPTGPCVGWLMNRFFPPFALYAGSEITVGRAADCHLFLQHNAISRKHATLRCGGEALVLNDLGSANGTLVNGKRITGPTKLQPGDVIDLGPYRISV